MRFECYILLEELLMNTQHIAEYPYYLYFEFDIVGDKVNVLVFISVSFVFDPVFYLFKPVVFVVFGGYDLRHFVLEILIMEIPLSLP